MLRPIALLLAAIALFLSPIMMTGGMAAASPMSSAPLAAGHAAMAMNGHCDGMRPVKGSGKDSMKIDCAAACSVLHATAPFLAQVPAIAPSAPSLRRIARLDGIDIGRELPPPRTISEI